MNTLSVLAYFHGLTANIKMPISALLESVDLLFITNSIYTPAFQTLNVPDHGIENIVV